MLESMYVILPSSLLRIVRSLPADILLRLEEIRVRENRPLEIVFHDEYGFVAQRGYIVQDPRQAYMPTREDCQQLLDLMTNHSMYAMEEQLKRGFITVGGGHRIGFAGRTVLEHGQVKYIRDISSFNIRLAREVIDAGRRALPYLLDYTAKSVHHTLIISPPQQGKTTIIRDLSRMISYGDWRHVRANWKGLKVGIVDERSELAACVQGVPTFDVGPRTDVLDNCPKAEGMMMMIRSMSPEVLIVDEIGTHADTLAIDEALHAGIRVIATAHGNSLQDIKRRPMLLQLLESNVFDRYILLSNRQGVGTIESIHDGNGEPMISNGEPRKAGSRPC